MSKLLKLISVQDRLTHEDRDMFMGYLGEPREPDLVIAPDGYPYIYRWHLTPKHLKMHGGVYLHVQVASDPERPLHDHPWDNQSVILSNGYDEIWNPQPWLARNEEETLERSVMRKLRTRTVVARKASEAHRLLLPKDFPYTMSLFSLGPVEREWGFWTDNGWIDARDMTYRTADGRSVHNFGGQNEDLPRHS